MSNTPQNMDMIEESNQRKILVTGYGPFLEHRENPSLKVATFMDELSDRCDHVELPVEFSKLDASLESLCLQNYDVIYLLGLAASRDVVTPEKVALNWCYCPGRPDNEGRTFERGEELVADSEAALFSSFPVEELSAFLNEKKVVSQLSFTAGTYVCNATYYKVLKACKETGQKVCFIHIPKDVDCKVLAQRLIEFSASLNLESSTRNQS